MEKHVAELARIQSETHQVAVAADQMVLQHLHDPIGCLDLPMRLNRRNPILWFRLWRVIQAYKPSIIHAHAAKAASLVASVRRFVGLKARYIGTIHGSKKRLNCWKGFDRVIAVSDAVGRNQGGLAYTVVWNGVSLPLLLGNSEAAGNLPFVELGRPILVAVGRLVEEKGFDLLLRAIQKIDCSLWLIGAGDLDHSLRKLAAELGIAERVWFAGQRNDVPQIMSRANLCVISSRREGFSLVLAEALHLRRPIVSTRIGDVGIILPTEWTCDPGNADQLSQLIRKALQDLPGLQADLEKAYRLAQQEMTTQRAAQRTEQIYRNADRAAEPLRLSP